MREFPGLITLQIFPAVTYFPNWCNPPLDYETTKLFLKRLLMSLTSKKISDRIRVIPLKKKIYINCLLFLGLY